MKSSTPIIDAHVHIFPPGMIAAKDELLIHDSWFAETYGHPKARMRTVEELIANMDKVGIDISIVVGWPWQHDAQIEEHNRYLAEAAMQYPERIRWLGIINPASESAREQIVWAAEHGASGFGELNADGQGFSWTNPAQYEESLELIAGLGLPVMTHTSEPVGHIYPGKGSAHPQEILAAIETVPVVKWVLAHWGGGLPFYELMPEVRVACANVAYDCAATSFLYAPSIFRRVIDLVGVEKVVYGSDWPVLAQGKLIARIREQGLTEDELVAVLGGNASRIYSIT